MGGIYYCNAKDKLYWLEGRPQEGGRNVLCEFDENQKVKDVTPKEANVRTRVHEYGGGALSLCDTTGAIYYSDFMTQQLCNVVDGKAVTNGPEGQYRYADGVIVDDGRTMYCVREDHHEDGKASPKDVVNEIVKINLSDGTTSVIATGNDFYSNPRLSSDRTQLSYVTWNHPNMPWDATELRVVDLSSTESSAKTSDHTLIAGQDGDTSILQPIWDPSNNNDLYYISDESGYYNIYKHSNSNDGKTENVLPMEYDFGGSAPGWALGQQGFDIQKDGKLSATYKKDGKSVLLILDLETKSVAEYANADGLPMQFGGMIPSGDGDYYFLGASPADATSIYKWNIQAKEPAEVLYCSSTLKFSNDVISVPKQIEFPTTGGKTAFGYYYPPYNAEYKATTEDKAPPLLVKAHGGPTACTGTAFNAGIQFWTSRGFAVLDVDYGGSTGYGRDYRRRLRKAWGIVDIDDVCAGAMYLVDQGLADRERLCIDGGSAGGFTTLGALAWKDVFKAGCSLYGVGDLTALAGDTHKFESRYLDGLVGAYPEEEELYKKRSPVESVETLSCPILLLQGDEDKIVPPNQAEIMHEALLKKGIPTCLKIYKGEQHGFRKAENIEDALDSELSFYGKVFGIDIPGAVELLIDNM